MMRVTCLLIVMFSQLFCLSQDTAVTGAADIKFVLIRPGSFLYGKYDPPFPVAGSSPNKDLRPQDFALAKKLAGRDALPGFTVNITEPFYIGQYEVTCRQWAEIMGSVPSAFKGDSLPVENITWNDAQQFIAKLNALDTTATYRLPTEFEWEYAARAGATDDISWDEIRLQAQIGTKTTNTIGQKKPNAWGLFDMIGNVWEWTQDIYNEKIFAGRTPPRKGSQHVLKGASFVGDVKNATYMTHAAGPGNGWDVGLRVVRMLGKSDAAVAVNESGNIVKSASPVPGWHLSRTTHQGTTPRVTNKNGIITIEQCPYGQGGVLLTDKKYKDFEISVEVKVDSFCNGGIFLRSSESGQAYQIELAEPGGTGNVFGEMMRISTPGIAKKKVEVWKPNDWNLFRVRMTGINPRIELWINNVLMYDVTEPQNDFVAGASEGMIGLQSHWSVTYSGASKAFDMSGSWRPGGRHQFRNIRITAL